MKKTILIILFMFFAVNIQAQETIISYDENSLPVLNEVLRLENESRRIAEARITVVEGEVVPLVRGGTGSALVDPNGDAVIYYDDSTDLVGFALESDTIKISNGTIYVDESGLSPNLSSGYNFNQSGTYTHDASGDNETTITVSIANGETYELIIEDVSTGNSDYAKYLQINNDGSGSNYFINMIGDTQGGAIVNGTSNRNKLLFYGTSVVNNNSLTSYSHTRIFITGTNSDTIVSGYHRFLNADVTKWAEIRVSGYYDAGLPTGIQIGTTIDAAGTVVGKWYLYKLNDS